MRRGSTHLPGGVWFRVRSCVTGDWTSWLGRAGRRGGPFASDERSDVLRLTAESESCVWRGPGPSGARRGGGRRRGAACVRGCGAVRALLLIAITEPSVLAPGRGRVFVLSCTVSTLTLLGLLCGATARDKILAFWALFLLFDAPEPAHTRWHTGAPADPRRASAVACATSD